MCMSSGSSTSGSPPQVRGKLHQVNASRSSAGITPAGAGKTRQPPLNSRSRWDHPRRCGENRAFCGRYGAAEGSPPQVRGKLCGRWSISALVRITPAGAGKTYPRLPMQSVFRDHPRRCGENQSPTLRPRGFGGSPPQVRGKLQVRKFAHISLRITPAGAGKTYWVDFGHVVNQDHPRRCGENSHSQKMRLEGLGSPPQVRGKPGYRAYGFFCKRITPAGAGKTCTKRQFGQLRKDHPRRCGENGLNLQTCHHMIGSPPQVRGKQIALLVGRGSPWITPAGAGKT